MSAISGLSSSQNLLPSRFGELKSEDFVKLIFTELRNQDPFKPNDSGELLKQIDSIRSIETNMELGKRMDQTALQNELSGAGDMIGRFVKGLSTEYQPVEGTVESVLRTSAGAVLQLQNGWRVPMSLVQSIGTPGTGG
ncbi:MAG: flagellar hook capping FlgD N-terminal domain-containing protein [Phycisphaerales bacterium]